MGNKMHGIYIIYYKPAHQNAYLEARRVRGLIEVAVLHLQLFINSQKQCEQSELTCFEKFRALFEIAHRERGFKVFGNNILLCRKQALY